MGNAVTPNNPPLQETAHKYGYPQAGVSCEENVTDKLKGKKKQERKMEGRGGLDITCHGVI